MGERRVDEPQRAGRVGSRVIFEGDERWSSLSRVGETVVLTGSDTSRAGPAFDPGRFVRAPSSLRGGGRRGQRAVGAVVGLSRPVVRPRATSGRALIGVNFPKFAESVEAPFGSNEAIWDDLVELGVDYVRQVGTVDIRFGGEVPLPVKTGRGDDEVLAALEDLWGEQLAELLRQAHDRGIMVVLTWLSLGGGADSTEIPDPLDEFADNSVPKLNWTLHEGESPPYPDSGAYTLGQGLGEGASARDFAIRSLDPRDRYKLEYFRYYAMQTGRLLKGIGRELGITLSDVILGIELTNELNTACRTGDVGTSAAYWADVVVAGMRGFAEAVDDYGMEELPLWLPALASPSSEDTRENVLDFCEALVDGVFRHPDRPSGTVVANQDVHWYRFDGENHLRPAAVELDGIGSDIEGVVSRAFAGASVTLSETGASCTRPEPARGQFFPDAYGIVGEDDPTDLDTDLSRRRFQAREVVRRLSTGLAAGFRAVAWQTHMASASSAFAGCGLREDGEDVASSAGAHRRIAWWTFQRLVAYFDGDDGTGGVGGLGGVTGGEVLHPTTTDPGTDDPAELLTVLRLDGTGSGTWRHAIILFIDSAATWAADSEEDAPLYVSVSASEDAPVQRVKFLPARVTYGGASSASGTFPTGDTEVSSTVDTYLHEADFTARLRVTGDPLVLLCDATPDVSYSLDGESGWSRVARRSSTGRPLASTVVRLGR